MYRLSLDNIKGYAVDVYKLPPNIWGEGNTLSEIGRIIQYCKYRKHSHFPKRIVNITKEKIEKFIEIKFDYIMFIPPTLSGNKVEEFTRKLSEELNVPMKKGLTKTCNTKKKFCTAQKYQTHKKEKQEIIFSCVECEEITNKNILLIDDMCGSGHTLLTATNFLNEYNPKTIIPVVLVYSGNNIKHELIG